MSKDITVLTPNGRRQKVHCTPNTSMLQVLEDVCAKQGFPPTAYGLKHHNHILDLTTTVRFSNLPNKATLEMVETERKREESNVTIGLLLEDGERRTADFPPCTSLYDLLTSMAPTELGSFVHPTILYLRQEVIGVPALRGKTLRQLGLIGGRAILRLLNKEEEESKQANVSAVYRRPFKENTPHIDEISTPRPSKAYKSVDPIKLIKEEVLNKTSPNHGSSDPTDKEQLEYADEKETAVIKRNQSTVDKHKNKETPMEIDRPVADSNKSSNTSLTQEILERRLRIEEEVTFLGTQKAVAFMQPEVAEDELDDLPDDFYELTIEEVRKLYRDLQDRRLSLENTPLLTSAKREDVMQQTSQQRLSGYKNVVVRVQFPDHMILQGIFNPSNTIQDVTNFIKEHLRYPEKSFHIFTTPLKETLDPKLTLLEAKLVPCVHMHFKWFEEDVAQPYLKEEVYGKTTSSDAARILASKYRAPSRRKMDDSTGSSHKSTPGPSGAYKNKMPRWFKN